MTSRMTIVSPSGLRRFRPAHLSGLAILPLAMSLAACSLDNPDAFAPSCPIVEVPGAAADLVAFTGPSHDIGHLASRASVTRVTGQCHKGEGKSASVVADISLGLNVTRGPGAGRTLEIPYFVAVVYGDEIKNKKQFTETVQFPANVTQMLTHTRIVPITLPVSKHVTIDGYRLEVGLQLTKEQLDYNQTHLIAPTFHHM
ncbi:hypothetical protein HLH36_13655 [Gluconacetobacter aggeris]|uniref:Uncharacterized protein n=1 Tax=Gluconacetobacter aggeris TaxID=1286186 RepID=A0A7W4IUW4_9PROT|nr:hypothetical protein [Gluconacetobacter aggeris]MBB2169383.1 hypothetical protein [Gluconacetobacter aggeris]